MIVPPSHRSGSLAPAVPGYSIFGRCWEDTISITFKGLHVTSNNPVFIRMTKVRRTDIARPSPLRQDFEISRKTNVKAILRPLDYTKVDGVEYVVLPNNGTQPLAELLLQRRLSFVDSLTLLIEIANKIGEIHQDGIVHGNINSNSMFVFPPLRSLITDFTNRPTKALISPKILKRL